MCSVAICAEFFFFIKMNIFIRILKVTVVIVLFVSHEGRAFLNQHFHNAMLQYLHEIAQFQNNGNAAGSSTGNSLVEYGTSPDKYFFILKFRSKQEIYNSEFL